VKIRVLIHRNTAKEVSPGRLSAFVLQSKLDGNGRKIDVRGSNLLAHHVFKNVDAAYIECDKLIREECKLVEPDIEYEVDEAEETKA